jgi:L-ascorbate metabolism protein UlaG (beta-lactamase superfamily)
VVEVEAGDRVAVGTVEVETTQAEHDGRRGPIGVSAPAVGFVFSGSRRVYFAGDTGRFDAMTELAPLDVALLPVSGWGPKRDLGEGHLDPTGAALALQALRPRLAIPIHWGALRPIGMSRIMARRMTEPPHEFARAAARLAPEVEVRVLEPGESLALPAPG